MHIITGFFALGFAVVAGAYIIDDTNSTVQYLPGQSWVQIANDPDLNNSQIYNAT